MYRLRNLLLFLFLIPFLFGGFLSAQWAVSAIPADLKKDADAVIRQHKTYVEIQSPSRTEITVSETITLLNKDTEGMEKVIIRYDELLGKVQNIEGYTYTANGRQFSKLKKKQIIEGDYPSSGLAGSSRYVLLAFEVPSYPFTISYFYKKVIPSLFYFPAWAPLYAEELSLEKAILDIRTPQDIPINYRWQGEGAEAEIKQTGRTNLHTWTLENLTFPPGEDLGLSHTERAPILFLTQQKLIMGDVSGSMNDWNVFGKMIYDLQAGRQDLPPDLAKKVTELIQDTENPHERISRLYQFMQANTRYVSIQLGIGGHQTFPASFVYENGYGECKALSNYMGSMLQYIGIPSYFTLVGAGDQKPPIMKDFAYSPFNHAILCAVPSPGDTVWLECTSSSAPSGYLGSFTEDRYVLLCTPEGGKLTRTPKAKAEDNLYQKNLEIELYKDGSALVRGELILRGEQDSYRLHSRPHKTQTKWLQRLLAEGGTIFIDSLSAEVDSSYFVPATRLRFQARATNWASVSGPRLFLKPNVLQGTVAQLPDMETRTQPIVNYYSFLKTDTVVYHLPEGFTVEALESDPIQIEEIFGQYQTQTEAVDAQTLRYIRSYQIERSRLPASYYEKFRQFLSEVAKADRKQVVLSNKS